MDGRFRPLADLTIPTDSTRIAAVQGPFSIRRPFLLFAVVSCALVAFGTVMLLGIEVDVHLAPGDDVHYLSMVCQCHWPSQNLPWSIHLVPSPFRYRILVPWIARQLPFGAATSLRLVTYASLGASYFVMLLTCQRLGLSSRASVGGLALAYVFEPHLYSYYNPFLVDGFGLMVVTGMAYAFVVDSFWMFALLGLTGLFAREVAFALLPLWCVRDVKRGLALTLIALLLLAVERIVLTGSGVTLLDASHIGLNRLLHLRLFAIDIETTWVWAWAVVPIGISLLPPRAFASIGPLSLVLLAAAVASSLLAADVFRMFVILMPVVAIGGAQLIATLTARKHVVWLAILFGLVAVQFCVSGANAWLGPDLYIAMATSIRTMRLGALWAAVAVFLLRRDVAQGVREKLLDAHLLARAFTL